MRKLQNNFKMFLKIIVYIKFVVNLGKFQGNQKNLLKCLIIQGEFQRLQGEGELKQNYIKMIKAI